MDEAAVSTVSLFVTLRVSFFVSMFAVFCDGPPDLGAAS